MSKQKIRQLALDKGFKLKEQSNGEMDLNPYVYDFAEALIKDQSAWNEERTTLLQAVRFYAEQADYSASWNVDSAFHVMEDRGAVARNALFQIDALPPTQEG